MACRSGYWGCSLREPLACPAYGFLAVGLVPWFWAAAGMLAGFTFAPRSARPAVFRHEDPAAFWLAIGCFAVGGSVWVALFLGRRSPSG